VKEFMKQLEQLEKGTTLTAEGASGEGEVEQSTTKDATGEDSEGEREDESKVLADDIEAAIKYCPPNDSEYYYKVVSMIPLGFTSNMKASYFDDVCELTTYQLMTERLPILRDYNFCGLASNNQGMHIK